MPLIRPAEPTSEDERLAEEKRLEEEKKANKGKGKGKKGVTKQASLLQKSNTISLEGNLGVPPAFARATTMAPAQGPLLFGQPSITETDV